MNRAARRAHDYVLAVHPTVTGFGWALFEGPLTPIDWGVVELKTGKADRNADCLIRFRELIDRYNPSAIVLEQFDGAPSRRAPRVQAFCRSTVQLARTKGIDIAIYSRTDIAGAFAPFGATTRRQIATALAAHIDAFEHLLPPERRIWQPESPRMGLFNAAAVAFCHYARDIDNATAAGLHL